MKQVAVILFAIVFGIFAAPATARHLTSGDLSAAFRT